MTPCGDPLPGVETSRQGPAIRLSEFACGSQFGGATVKETEVVRLRTFRKIRPQRAESDDGVAVYSVDRWTKRYERPDRYCDLGREAVIENGEVWGSAITLYPHTFTNRPILWHFKDGSTAPVTDVEKEELKADIAAAYAALGSRVIFE